MSVYVFLGPSLPVERAGGLLVADYLPPVQQGDVLRLLPGRPRAIGIVDGYFDTVPAVWHKEILLAMAQGVHVFGAASMGALRAAELHAFGMVGVGRVFEWYRDGVLTGDDEVAVAHGPDDTGYRSSCDALVDIRDACDAATVDGLLPAEMGARLVAIGKALRYPDRSYRAVAARGRAEGLEAAVLDRWLAYVAARGPGRKQRDAEAMLRAMRAFLEASPAPKQVDYQVERTVFLEQFRHEVALAEVARLGRSPAHDDEPLRAGETRAGLRDKQLLRLLARREADRLGWRLTTDEVQDCADRFRVQHGLDTPEAMSAWMGREGLTEAAFWLHVQDACMIERFQRLHRQDIDAGLPDQLRLATASLTPDGASPRGGEDGNRMAPAAAVEPGSNPERRGDERPAVVRKKILLRLLASREMARRGLAIPSEEVERRADSIRRRSGLEADAEWQGWLATEGLSEAAFLAVVREFAAVERVQALYVAEIDRGVSDHVRVSALRDRWSAEPSQ